MRSILLTFPIMILLVACGFNDQDAVSNTQSSLSSAQDRDPRVEFFTTSEPWETPTANLKRPYFRIYRNDRGGCYLLPKPDTFIEQAELCTDTEFSEQMAVDKYCKSISNPEHVNNMPCEQSHILAEIMHSAIDFEEPVYAPYPYLDDRVAACSIATCKNNTDLFSFCTYYQNRYDRSIANHPITLEGRVDSQSELQAVQPCLNEVYGVLH